MQFKFTNEIQNLMSTSTVVYIYIFIEFLLTQKVNPQVDVRSQDRSLSPLSRIEPFDSLLKSPSYRSTGPFGSSPVQRALGGSSNFSV